MTRYLIGVDTTDTAEKLVSYLQDRVTDDDTVYAVNSLYGESETSDAEVVEGREATEYVEDHLPDVDAHQLIRGNSPQEDLVQFADEHAVEELVIGIRKRSPTGKLVFGSTAQDLLLETTRPTVVVPLTDA
ncbi:universal stress protein [Haloglomus irregulare]|jgi:nucleotide-binding universal stress UspA family protein|uniref:Universal stress protein n=1 Tax=Haloglomus irregulare TaxID=2234134 RepID=A0A554NA39_9EURY|nr:universal stress protein [Haloglomus irregulare]TSD14251.1 universal stress protein [Haloglomus irregulare]